MDSDNNIYLEKLKVLLKKAQGVCARFYRPGMSLQGPVQNIIDWTG